PALSPEPTSEPLETLLRLRLIEQIPDLGDRLASLLQLVDILTPASASSAPDPAVITLMAQAEDLVPQQPPPTQAEWWLAIAERYLTLGQPEAALKALTEAEAAVAMLKTPFVKAQHLQAIAAHRADLLQPSQAIAALEQASALVSELPSPQASLLLTTLALQYADLGQHQESAALLARADLLLAQAPQEAPQEAPVIDDIETLPPTPLTPQPWDGSVGLLGNLFSGESSRGVISLTADADRQWGRTAADFGLQLTYNIDDDEDDPDQFSVRFDADAEHYLEDNWQYFIDGSVASDDLENLQLRATLFNGVGIRLLRSEDQELGIRTGVGIRYENFEDEGPDVNPPSLTLGFTYRDRLFELVQLQQSLDFDAPLGDVEDYLFRSETNLRIPISERWSFDQGLRLTLSGESAPDNPGLLLNLQTGLRYQF
ncbi:MAG: DUF481 domain-containing protein, partial [Cyanobacteria bacterium P01_A01_bin.135]